MAVSIHSMPMQPPSPPAVQGRTLEGGTGCRQTGSMLLQVKKNAGAGKARLLRDGPLPGILAHLLIHQHPTWVDSTSMTSPWGLSRLSTRMYRLGSSADHSLGACVPSCSMSHEACTPQYGSQCLASA